MRQTFSPSGTEFVVTPKNFMKHALDFNYFEEYMGF